MEGGDPQQSVSTPSGHPVGAIYPQRKPLLTGSQHRSKQEALTELVAAAATASISSGSYAAANITAVGHGHSDRRRSWTIPSSFRRCPLALHTNESIAHLDDEVICRMVRQWAGRLCSRRGWPRGRDLGLRDISLHSVRCTHKCSPATRTRRAVNRHECVTGPRRMCEDLRVWAPRGPARARPRPRRGRRRRRACPAPELEGRALLQFPEQLHRPLEVHRERRPLVGESGHPISDAPSIPQPRPRTRSAPRSR